MDERPNRPHRAAPDSESDRGLFLERAAKSFQESVTRAGPVALASYTLIGAILLLGGIGYALDIWRGSGHWFLLAGLFLGIIVGFYELAKAVFHK
jgi:F0F1-type ATP synthase assembly protein I